VFLLNNLFLTAFMFTVLTGTLFPLVEEAINGAKVSVGEPFFNRMSLPIVVTLLFLMGVGPALPWKAASKEELKSKLLPPAAGAAVMLVVALIVGARNPYALLAFAFAGYAAFANLREYWIGMRARHSAHGENWGTALVRLVGGNRHRYGGYTAHLGIILVAFGVAASSTFRSEHEATIKPGETISLAGQTLRLKEMWGREEPQRSVVGATLEVMNGTVVGGTMEPRMNFYPMSQSPVPTPAVRSGFLGDLYVNLQAFRQDGSNATIRVIYEPLVPWIWFGGGVIVFGALIAIFPAGVGVRRRDA
jgi:cytochrome c-type biogenesis protein CcmF